MELRHLHYFKMVAEELNFSRAADRLHMAQPPLSQQIRQLETELGFPLFYRTKRSVQLTEAGQVFLQATEKLLQQLQQAVLLGRQASRGEVGHLVIGFVSSATYNILPPILRSCRKSLPGVTLELRELTTDQQMQSLLKGEIDLGLVRSPIETPEIHSERLFQEPLIVALPESHALCEQAEISVRSLANEAFLLFPRQYATALYDAIIRLCQQAGFSPTVVQEAIQMQTIISLVAAEMGLAIVPASLQHLQRAGVVYKPLQEPTPEVAIALIWRQQPAPAVQRFLQVARQVTQQGDEPIEAGSA